jgi:hypothetical protein
MNALWRRKQTCEFEKPNVTSTIQMQQALRDVPEK